ncbi:hypothetical protein Q5P01_011949 [Channa striata]|uniref:Uncharacterized protein n=1 Tax=Channa striata TaxID=64152 RepID=A0AA88SQJ2_CHASR|nr:hypothetical protein Q5P01_011949 [Channa striata]
MHRQEAGRETRGPCQPEGTRVSQPRGSPDPERCWLRPVMLVYDGPTPPHPYLTQVDGTAGGAAGIEPVFSSSLRSPAREFGSSSPGGRSGSGVRGAAQPGPVQLRRERPWEPRWLRQERDALGAMTAPARERCRGSRDSSGASEAVGSAIGTVGATTAPAKETPWEQGQLRRDRCSPARAGQERCQRRRGSCTAGTVVIVVAVGFGATSVGVISWSRLVEQCCRLGSWRQFGWAPLDHRLEGEPEKTDYGSPDVVPGGRDWSLDRRPDEELSSPNRN